MITIRGKNRKSRRLHYLSNLLLTSILPQVPETRSLEEFPFLVQSRGKVPFSTNLYVVYKVQYLAKSSNTLRIRTIRLQC